MISVTRLSLGVSGHSHVHPRLAGLVADAPGRHAFPAGWALIEHREHGAILFDCGYGAPARTAMERGMRRVYRHLLGACCPPAGDATALLRARGIAPEQVATVVISHFHPDHIGALREFPAARFIASGQAWASVGRGALARLHAQIWRELLPPDFAARLTVLPNDEMQPLAGDLAGLGVGTDVLGDGSLIAFALPGHADGQIGLALMHEGERVLLVADAFWQSEQLNSNLRLSWLARRLAMHRLDAYDATLARLRGFRQDHPNAWVIPSHCSRTLAAWASRYPGDVLDEIA